MHVLMRKEDAAREAPSDKLRVVTESYSIKIALIGGGGAPAFEFSPIVLSIGLTAGREGDEGNGRHVLGGGEERSEGHAGETGRVLK